MISGISNCCEIYYNDEIEPQARKYFTIPHEIGHISLGHNLHMSGETRKQKQEADFFATEFYCPRILLKYFNLETKTKLVSAFHITASYADIILEKLDQRGNYFSMSEKRLLNFFFTNRKKRNL